MLPYALVALVALLLVSTNAQPGLSIQYAPTVISSGQALATYSPTICVQYAGVTSGRLRAIIVAGSGPFANGCISSVCPLVFPFGTFGQWNPAGSLCSNDPVSTFSLANGTQLALQLQLWDNAGNQLVAVGMAATSLELPPPTFNPINAIYAQQYDVISYQLVCSSSNGGSVSFFSPNLPQGATVSASGLFTWSPAASGAFNAMFVCTDSVTQIDNGQATTIYVGLGQSAPPPLSNPPPTKYSVLQYGFDHTHSNNNAQEAILDPQTVPFLTRTFTVSVAASPDNAPVLLPNVATVAGTHDVLFLSSRDGHLYALDASTGLTIWSNPPVAAGSCYANPFGPCYHTATPAIDPNGLYIYAVQPNDGTVRRYSVVDGSEVAGNGWPLQFTLKPSVDKAASSITIVTARNGNNYLYVVTAGMYLDQGDYQGRVISIDLASGQANIWNALCSNMAILFPEQPAQPNCPVSQAGIWSRSGVMYYPALDRIFFATGNAPFAPGSYNWGQSLLSLAPDGSASTTQAHWPVDSYTPENAGAESQIDLDLGGVSPVIIPVPAACVFPFVVAQGGKDSLLRLLDGSNLSGQGGAGKSGGEISVASLPQNGVMVMQPVVWVHPGDQSTWVFSATVNGICAHKLQLDSRNFPFLVAQWTVLGYSSSAIIANNVLIHAGPGAIWARDPITGTLLWNDTTTGGVHWQSPIVANGMLYLTSAGSKVFAWSIPPSRTLPPSSTTPSHTTTTPSRTTSLSTTSPSTTSPSTTSTSTTTPGSTPTRSQPISYSSYPTEPGGTAPPFSTAPVHVSASSAKDLRVSVTFVAALAVFAVTRIIA